MIHYNLQCAASHAFDGWFKDSASFDKQARRGLLECPVCGSPKVERALMTPAVPRKGKPARNAVAVLPPAPPVAVEGPMAVAGVEKLPDHVRAVLQRMRAEVEKNCDYVGPGFAEEARRIHKGEADTRGIYGESTPEEAEALADEGITVSQIPWLPRADS